MRQGTNGQLNQQNSNLFKYPQNAKPTSASNANSEKVGETRSHADMNGSGSGLAPSGMKSSDNNGVKLAKTSDSA